MIDRQTIEKIKDAANIVDVVSEFVTLRKSGANYKGLCPFHNEKTPSFYVSPARGTCHCFGCGKGGNAVSFVMEHEQMTYPESLRWLANKYNIEIKERELTDDEKREQSERESMFIVNEWAANYFHTLLHDNPDGVAIGMQYFRSRGFRDDIIEKFRLGYDVKDKAALAKEALAKGYNTDFVVKAGICYKTEQGEMLDRYAGRVIFPWIGVNGKVVGFGGRVLDSRTKGVNQKYVNSPESDIYHKDHELYGIYQAKKAIAKEDRVYMVEGYTDVISMHQCGIENVVANSGTALSVHQIHTLHRFTLNITLLYDGDAAGIHAALRGTDMLLAEGMNLKMLLLPDGDDPDSFARKHTASDFRAYIEEHQTDFIQFKTDLLLREETDPIKRSEGINSIVRSISMVENQILRDTYIHDCSQRMGMHESTLINTMNGFIRADKEAQHSNNRYNAEPQEQSIASIPVQQSNLVHQSSNVEKMLIQMIVKNGAKVIYNDVEEEGGQIGNVSVSQYINYSLKSDNLKFSNDLFNEILDEAVVHNDEEDFDCEQYFVHHQNIEISRIAISLCEDRYQLISEQSSEWELKKDKDLIEKEKQEKLRNQTIHLLLDFRMDYVEQRLKELQSELIKNANDMEKMRTLMDEFKTVQNDRNLLAKQLGNSIIL